MKSIIYYFTGTGNSLAVAKQIAATLGDCELVNIASQHKKNGNIVPQVERVGIICPVYFTGIPVMVAAFAEHLEIPTGTYVFSVVTHGGGGGSGALRQIDGILRIKNERGLDAGFAVSMPGNYILMYNSPEGEKKENILARAGEQIADIADLITRCESHALPSSMIITLLHPLAYSWFKSRVHTADQKFTVSEDCTSCGICESVCPAHNIELVDKKPTWKHHCELCCGCIHLCPVGAIQAGRKTMNRQRYQNPSVTLEELKRKKG